MPEAYVEVDGGRLYYDDVGYGPRTIVWIHSLPLNGGAWRMQIAHFAPNYRNIVIDLRGYGRSSKLSADVSSVTELYVNDLKQLFTHLDLERAMVVGFASGGHAAMRFSALHGELVERLALISASPKFGQGPDWPWGFNEIAIATVNKTLSTRGLTGLCELLLGNVFQDVDAAQAAILYASYQQMSLMAGAETISAFFNNIAKDDDRALDSAVAGGVGERQMARRLLAARQVRRDDNERLLFQRLHGLSDCRVMVEHILRPGAEGELRLFRACRVAVIGLYQIEHIGGEPGVVDPVDRREIIEGTDHRIRGCPPRCDGPPVVETVVMLLHCHPWRPPPVMKLDFDHWRGAGFIFMGERCTR